MYLIPPFLIKGSIAEGLYIRSTFNCCNFFGNMKFRHTKFLMSTKYGFLCHKGAFSSFESGDSGNVGTFMLACSWLPRARRGKGEVRVA